MGIFAALAVGLEVYGFILLARALISWFRPDPYNPIVRFLYDVTEPVLQPARNVLPSGGMIDWSFIVVYIVLRLLISFLRSMG